MTVCDLQIGRGQLADVTVRSVAARADRTDIVGRVAGTPDEVKYALEQLRELESDRFVPVTVTPCDLAHLPIGSGFYSVAQVELSMVAL